MHNPLYLKNRIEPYKKKWNRIIFTIFLYRYKCSIQVDTFFLLVPTPKCTESWFGTVTCTCDTGYKYEKETATCHNQQCDKDCGVKGHCEFDPSVAMLCICNPGVEIDFWSDKCE